MSSITEIRSLLEFDKILKTIQEKAISTIAAHQLSEIPFLTKLETIRSELTKVEELAEILKNDAPFPFNIWDIKQDLETASVKGAFLAPAALIRIANTLSTCGKVYSYLKKRAEQYPTLLAITHKLQPFKEIQYNISAKIDFQQVEVKSSASPALANIRKEIRHAEQKARREIDRLFKVYRDNGYLQEDIITLKDGRRVFPVKVESRRRVKGLLHDQSATGATLFIEPIESVELNNELISLKRQEQAEVEKILREITDEIHINLEALTLNFVTLIEFDVIRAKALFSNELECITPDFNQKNKIDIIKGRHPLLSLHKKEQVVPLNLKISGDITTLVITGPNAGGKSVALKAIGLFALMAQSGIPIPVAPDSTLPVFSKIFADIGDFQSIEQDLSTFSSHIGKIKNILQNVDKNSLVLMDEIGVGTDPDEGAALSIAFLTKLSKTGCKTMVTTHLGGLKAFAFNTPGIENGSMEFDVNTLEPTYRFKIGVPGSSYALEISKRLGIPEDVLNQAKRELGSEKQKLENLILELDKKSQVAQKLISELELEKIRLAGLSNLYRGKVDSIKKEENSRKKQALLDSQQILDQSNAIIEKAIKDIKENQANKESIQKAKEELVSRKQDVKNQLQKIATPSVGLIEKEFIIEVGSKAFWNAQKKDGEILAVQDGGTKVLFQADNLKIWVSRSELSAPKQKPIKATQRVKINAPVKSDMLPQIDVRGALLEEAIFKVDKFIDDALLADWPEVRIIHGKGTGALRKGIQDFLKNHARIKSTKFAEWNQGDLGVTIAELD